MPDERRPGDVLPERKKFEGDRVKIEEIVGKEITILDWFTTPSTLPGQEGKFFAVINIIFEEKKAVLLTGSGVLMGVLLGRAQDGKPIAELKPFKTTISQVPGKSGFTYYQFDYVVPLNREKKESSEKEPGGENTPF